MWKGVRNSGRDFKWVIKALEEGTGTWVTDGSYMPEERQDACSACWIFHCQKTGHKLIGCLYEESDQASSYRGERLGLLAIHLLLAAIAKYFKVTIKPTKICCDNKGGLYKASERRKRVTPGAPEADIERVMRRISRSLPPGINYKWVASHQDSKKARHDLTLEEQLSTECNLQVKETLRGSLNFPPRKQLDQLLPL